MDRLVGLLGDQEPGAPGVPLEDAAVGLVSLGARQPELEAEQPGRVDPGIGDVVPIADPRDDLSLPTPQRFADGQEVGEDLAGVQQVGEPVDDRDAGEARQLLHLLVGAGADDQGVEVAREHPRRVPDRLPPVHLALPVGEEDRVGAELERADLEGDPGPGRALGEEEPDASPGERPRPVRRALEVGREREGRRELIPGEIGDRQEVALARHSRRALEGVNLAAGV